MKKGSKGKLEKKKKKKKQEHESLGILEKLLRRAGYFTFSILFLDQKEYKMA